MSTLSELIPSGGTQNNIEFVAQGTLANGQAVALRSDGKVEAISGIASSVGAVAQFSGSYALTRSTYDSTANKVVVSYRDNNNNDYGYSVVGTISGTSVTFGTPVVFESAGTAESIPVYDASNNKIVIAWRRKVGSDEGYAIVGTVSGTSISYGSSSIFHNSYTNYVTAVYEPNSQKVVIAYQDGGNSNYGTAIVATVSGTSVSFGSEYVFISSTLNDSSDSCVNTTDNTVNIIYRDGGASNTIKMSIATVSGTALTFGSVITVSGTSSNYCAIDYNSTNNKVVVAYQDGGNSNYGTARVGTSDGSTGMTFGTLSTFQEQTVDNVRVVFNQTSNNVAIIYRDNVTSPYSSFSSVGTLSGTDISFANRAALFTTNNEGFGPVYDPTANKVFVSSREGSSYFQALVYTMGETNASDFVGITNAAISSSATGEVAVKGGLSTGGNVLPYAPTAGSPVTYESGFAVTKSVSYDTNANKAVIANRRGSDDYGIVYVGTVSGTSISFGSVVVFNAGTTEYISSAFDSNANKVVIAYTDSGNSGHGTAIVGTVSGTSISFGSEVVFEAAAVNGKSIVFDSTSNKVVIFYEDDANNDYGTAVVGTVSGTSISFGTPVVFASVNMQITEGEGAAYDSANNRAVVFYRNSNYEGYAAVGTVSGTSISFGTPVKFSSGAAELDYISAAFDSAANKIVTSYTVNTDSSYSKAIVGTVSGTSISFGSEATFESANSGYTSATFNSTINKVVISYSDFANSNYGTLVISTISGTSISFTTPAVFTSTTAARYISTAFDPDTGSVISGFSDQNNSYYAKSVVTSFSNALTIGSNYFVQDDGTLATTSSTTKAGKAISTTALNLVDPT